LRLQVFNAHRHYAVTQHAQAFGGFLRKIDDALFGVGAAVVDAHHHAFVVTQVGHLYLAAKRQAAVRGGQRVLVEAFAAGGFVAVVACAVIRRLAFGAIALRVDLALAGAGAEQ
jgi:hypothetical protein